HGFGGKAWPTAVVCLANPATCARVSNTLQSVGAQPPGSDTGQVGGPSAPSGAVAVVVGTWPRIRSNSAARLLDQHPDGSGVFARFVGDKRPLLELENRRGEPAGSIGKGGGLSPPPPPGDGPPTWVVTGTDRTGVSAAANLLGDPLQNHYAVAAQ